MVIRKNRLYLFLATIFLLADCRLFYLVPLPSFLAGAGSNKALAGIISLMVFIIFACTSLEKFKLGRFGGSIFFFLLFLFFQGYVEHLNYGYKFSSILFSILPFFTLLMYFLFIRLFENNLVDFIRIAEKIALILGVLLLLQLVYYDIYHSLWLHFTMSDWYTIYHPTAPGRFYSVAEGFIRVMPLLSMYLVLDENIPTQKTDYFSIVVLILVIAFVDQSRIYLIATLISMLIMYASLNSSKISSGRFLGIIILILLASLVVIPKLQSIVSSLTDPSNGSNYARFGAISYYWSLMKSYWLTGLGIVIPDEYSQYYTLIKGPNGIYNFDDIGLFGILAAFGVIILIWYLTLLIRNFSTAKKVSDPYLKALSFGLLIQLLICVFTESYLDVPRLFALTITMSIISVASYHSTSNDNDYERNSNVRNNNY